MTFFQRLKLALRILFGAPVAEILKALPEATGKPELPAPAPVPVVPSAPAPTPKPAEVHASALFVLGLLQREGRLLDFLQEDVSQASDGDLGAAARVVHDGCKKVLGQYLPLAPVVKDQEGATVAVPKGFDANRFRLSGNVTGEGPWSGALKHHGWVASDVKLPSLPTSVDVTVLAPAEVELP
jgi:hypothetical protein